MNHFRMLFICPRRADIHKNIYELVEHVAFILHNNLNVHNETEPLISIPKVTISFSEVLNLI